MLGKMIPLTPESVIRRFSRYSDLRGLRCITGPTSGAYAKLNDADCIVVTAKWHPTVDCAILLNIEFGRRYHDGVGYRVRRVKNIESRCIFADERYHFRSLLPVFDDIIINNIDYYIQLEFSDEFDQYES